MIEHDTGKGYTLNAVDLSEATKLVNPENGVADRILISPTWVFDGDQTQMRIGLVADFHGQNEDNEKSEYRLALSMADDNSPYMPNQIYLLLATILESVLTEDNVNAVFSLIGAMATKQEADNQVPKMIQRMVDSGVIADPRSPKISTELFRKE